MVAEFSDILHKQCQKKKSLTNIILPEVGFLLTSASIPLYCSIWTDLFYSLQPMQLNFPSTNPGKEIFRIKIEYHGVSENSSSAHMT
jgi:hypothetical protein